jgi:hypothetical protein
LVADSIQWCFLVVAGSEKRRCERAKVRAMREGEKGVVGAER